MSLQLHTVTYNIGILKFQQFISFSMCLKKRDFIKPKEGYLYWCLSNGLHLIRRLTDQHTSMAAILK